MKFKRKYAKSSVALFFNKILSSDIDRTFYPEYTIEENEWVIFYRFKKVELELDIDPIYFEEVKRKEKERRKTYDGFLAEINKYFPPKKEDLLLEINLFGVDEKFESKEGSWFLLPLIQDEIWKHILIDRGVIEDYE